MTTIVTIDMGGTGATHAAGAREALSVPSMTEMSNVYAQANAAYTAANSASGVGGGGYDQANAAYTQANTARNTANNAYTQANNARSDANTTFAIINTSFGTINTNATNINSNAVNAYAQANDAYGQANTARSDANTTFGTINTTFGTVNTSFGTINTNYQAAYAQANTARTTANDAYATANTKLGTSGGSISGDLTISGNLTVQGNATTINVSNLSVNDSIILLSANSTGDAEDIGFIGHITRDSTNTHVGLIRKATENRFYLFDNYEVEPTNNTIDITGNNFRVGNIRLGIINANSFVTAAGLDVTGQANAAYGQANTARSDANTTFATINTTFGTINTSLGTINTNYQAAYAQANTARTTANDAYGQANAAYGQANAAYGAANNRVLKAGDTMTGQLNISSGGLLVTGNSNFDGGTLFVDSVNDRVGIGTTSPASKLDVQETLSSTAWTRILSRETANNGAAFIGVYRNGSTYSPGVFAHSGELNSWANLWINAHNDGSGGVAGGTAYNVIMGGNVGIGTAAPATRLNVYSGSNDPTIRVTTGGAGAWLQTWDTTSYYSGVRHVGVNGSRRWITGMSQGIQNYCIAMSDAGDTNRFFTIDTSGNVGIGTTSPSAKLHVYNGAPSGAGSVPTGTNVLIDNNANNFITFRHSADSALYSGIVFEDNNIGGYVIHGDGSSGDKLYIAGYGGVEIQHGSASSVTPGARTTIGNFTSSGLAVTGTISESSSITIKENIIPISDALKIVLQLSGVTYDRIDGTAKKRAGLIAEQVNAVLPNVVQKDEQGNPSGIQYTNLIAYLVESIKELKAEIDTLKGK